MRKQTKRNCIRYRRRRIGKESFAVAGEIAGGKRRGKSTRRSGRLAGRPKSASSLCNSRYNLLPGKLEKTERAPYRSIQSRAESGRRSTVQRVSDAGANSPIT